jgi:hypothetical protein
MIDARVGRQTRNYNATACAALCMASFPSFMWLFFKYQSIRPQQRHPELGFVHGLNNHGSLVYLTDVEATGLSFLMGMFFLGLGLFLAIVPKKYTPTGFEHDLINPSREQYLVLWLAVTCYLAIIKFVGPYIVAFAVSRGLIISM